VSFTVNGNGHHMGYYPVDGSYASWPVFMKGVPLTQQEKHQFFSVKQASLRKDIECVFCLLKRRFNILAISARSYSQQTHGFIMRDCIILHNMIIDDEHEGSFVENYHTVTSIVAPQVN
jgi:hypothetical protein